MSSPTLSQRWAALKARLKQLFDEYGTVALVVWFTIFGLTVAGFYVALSRGMDVGADAGTVSSAGLLGTAYLLTQGTKPVRILATLALTPAVAKVVGRRKAAPVDAG